MVTLTLLLITIIILGCNRGISDCVFVETNPGPCIESVFRISRLIMPKNRNRNKSVKQLAEIPAQKLVYTGPIRPLSENEQLTTKTVFMSSTGFISSSAAGKILSVFSNDPSTTVDWTSFANSFHEYRVLGIRLEYFPNNRYSKTTTTCRPVISIVDRTSDVTALSSYGVAVAHESAHKVSLEDPWFREAKMSGSEEAVFAPTTLPTITNAIKLYADGLTVSTEYGMYVLYYLVQFRGRA